MFKKFGTISTLVILSLSLTLPVSAAEFQKNLKFGAKGSDVSKLQEFLIDGGYYTGPVTGNFYSLTLKAVKSYQKAKGLPATGFVGALTRNSINTDLDQELADQQTEPDFVSTTIEVASTTSDVVNKLNEQTKLISEQNRLLQEQLNKQQEQTSLLQQQINQQQVISQPAQAIPEPTPVIVDAPVVQPKSQVFCYSESPENIVCDNLSDVKLLTIKYLFYASNQATSSTDIFANRVKQDFTVIRTNGYSNVAYGLDYVVQPKDSVRFYVSSTDKLAMKPLINYEFDGKRIDLQFPNW
jgi:peptidoglycan hydrolase-like protein with peptidoglycan-binding domain